MEHREGEEGHCGLQAGPKGRVHLKTPGTMNANLFGKQVFADVIK